MSAAADTRAAAPRAAPSLVRYRCAVASRALAAIGGGYALSAACAAGTGLLFARWGMVRSEAVMAATLLAFLVHGIAALWAFGCASAQRAWLGIGIPAAALGALTWWLQRTMP